MSTTSLTLAIIFVPLAAFLVNRRRKGLHPPPGPPGLPIIGNFLDLPTKGFDWLIYDKWCDQYGPIVSASVMGTTIVVLGSYEKAQDILVKKAPQFSGRPRLPIVTLTGWENSLVWLQYGHDLRECRKVFHGQLGNPKELPHFHPFMETAAIKFVKRCVKNPSDLSYNTRFFGGSLILRFTYGYDVAEENDPFLKHAIATVENAKEWATPSKYLLINTFPSLRCLPEWFPGAQFQKVAREAHRFYDAMVNVPFQWAEQQLAKGTEVEALVTSALRRGLHPTEYEFAKHTAGILFSAGVDTSGGILHYLFYALLKYPEIQAQLQAEVDGVVHGDQPPTFADRPKLPLLEAFIKELLRYYPVTPYGVPHRSDEDYIYDGYLIPKDSIMIGLTWRLTRDPNVYVSPETFNPSRFLGPNPEQDPHDYSFGFGRRICPGRFFADSGMWIAAVTTIWALHIKPVLVNGKREIPELKVMGALVSDPEPFPCDISFRREIPVGGDD